MKQWTHKVGEWLLRPFPSFFKYVGSFILFSLGQVIIANMITQFVPRGNSLFTFAYFGQMYISFLLVILIVVWFIVKLIGELGLQSKAFKHTQQEIKDLKNQKVEGDAS